MSTCALTCCLQGIIDYTPPWANGGKDQMVPPLEAHVASFGRFAGYLASRYAPMGVHAWEIWNESNLVNFWSTGGTNSSPLFE